MEILQQHGITYFYRRYKMKNIDKSQRVKRLVMFLFIALPCLLTVQLFAVLDIDNDPAKRLSIRAI